MLLLTERRLGGGRIGVDLTPGSLTETFSKIYQENLDPPSVAELAMRTIVNLIPLSPNFLRLSPISLTSISSISFSLSRVPASRFCASSALSSCVT